MDPPNIAALFSPTAVSEKLWHGGGASPVTAGELQPSGGDEYYRLFPESKDKAIILMLYHSLVEREKTCCSLVHTPQALPAG